MKQSWLVGVMVVAGIAAMGMPSASAQLASAEVDIPTGELALGTVELPRRVMANGQTLGAGSYDVQLTAQAADPSTVGALQILERWVEFRQGDEVKGREVVSIVPGAEIGEVAKSAPPGSGSSRVELLRENEFLRVWINQGGTHFLIHLTVG